MKVSRRKSTLNWRHPRSDESLSTMESTMELERLEQEITLVLQQIDQNITKSTGIINEKIYPILRRYATASAAAWENTSFWKDFLEEAADVEIQDIDEQSNKDTRFNTMANAQNYLLSDDEELEPVAESKKSRRPNEETSTWTAEQEKRLAAKNDIHLSTPQLLPRPSLPISGAGIALRFDSNDTFAPPPPKVLSHVPSPSLEKPYPVVSLETHKVMISPRKRNPRTPKIDADSRRRSSMIQNFINSSPTLPEPPVLMSDIGRFAGSDSNPEHLERLSPIELPKERTPQRLPDLQRFPHTPLAFESRNVSRTPLAVRARYGDDDSDLQPPPVLQNEKISSVEDPEDVPLPDLQTIEIPQKRPLPEDDDEDNVFLDKSGSKNSTMYHSIVEEPQRNLFGNVNDDSHDDTTGSLGPVLTERLKKITKH